MGVLKNKKMKRLIKKAIATVVVGIMLTLNVQAAGNDKNSKPVLSNVSETIKDHVKFPKLLLNYKQEENVNVVFTVDELGKVNLVVANTDNLVLKQAIETQFAKLKLTQLKANNTYSIQFKFKTL